MALSQFFGRSTRCYRLCSRLGLSLLMLGALIVPVTSRAETVAAISTPVSSLHPESPAFLYGVTRHPEQVGQGYLVFQQQGHQVVGALYYPRSEFNCFVGKIQGERLQVTIFGYEQEPPVQAELALSSLHQFDRIGHGEQESLRACQRSVATLTAAQP